MVKSKEKTLPASGRIVKQNTSKTLRRRLDSPVLRKLAIAFAIVLLATALYTVYLAPRTLEAKQRVKLESTQSQLIETQQRLKKEQSESAQQSAEKQKQLEEVQKQLEETQRQLQAKRQANTALASAQPGTAPAPVVRNPLPANQAKAFIYMHESGNRTDAINASSGACGLGQALPCSKLPCSLQDYACQDQWFTNYAMQRYGSWENAYAFWVAHQWW